MRFAPLRQIEPLAAILLLLLSVIVLPYPGIQTDEALSAAATVEVVNYKDQIVLGKQTLPTMLMTFLGALKTWLYYPILYLFAPSVWSLRLPMLLAAAGTVWLFGRLLGNLYGPAAAACGALLLATDPSFVLISTFDWGPVALLQLLLVSALVLVNRWWRTGQNPPLLLAGFFLGLALWGKALMLWVLGGLVVATIVILPWFDLRALLQKLRAGGLLWLALGVLLGASPLIRYNLSTQGSTLSENTQFDTQQFAPKLAVLRTTLEGRSLAGFLVRDAPGQEFPRTGLVILVAGAVICMAVLRDARPLFPLAAGVTTWLLMALTRDAGGGAHHSILVWPFPQWLVAVAAAGLWSRLTQQWARTALVLVLVVSLGQNLRVWNQYRENLLTFGSTVGWTDAVFPLHDRLQRFGSRRLVLSDWGLDDSLRFLSQRPGWLHRREPPFAGPIFNESDVWVAHVDGAEVFAGINAELRAAAQQAGFERRVLDIVPDRHRRPIFEIFEWHRRGAAAPQTLSPAQK